MTTGHETTSSNFALNQRQLLSRRDGLDLLWLSRSGGAGVPDHDNGAGLRDVPGRLARRDMS